MAMSDPIADLLTRIRNGIHARHATVEIPASRLKEDICAVLKREGFIEDFEAVDKGAQGVLRITLKYAPDRTPVLQGLRRISKPSLRVYARCTDIRQVRSGLGIAILSTSRGLVTGREARDAKVGGEIICEVW
jgi:small subunit ribosomal protein S8